MSTRRGFGLAAILVAVACGGQRSAGGEARAPGAVASPRRLVGGHLGSCLLGQGEPRCWGPISVAEARTKAVAGPRVVSTGVHVSGMALGAGYVCLVAGGEVRCADESGTGFAPIALTGRARAVAAGWDRACAVLEAGHVTCWGKDRAASVVDGLDRVSEVVVGVSYACALRDDGRVFCWGGNEAGMLGDGTTVSRDTPGPVVDLADVVTISARNLHTCALLRGGTVRCWGLGDDGQLGDGIDRATDGHATRPVSVAGIRGASAIAAGNAHTCALVDGRVSCWGGNGVGQVGDGTTTKRLAPVAVPGLAGVVEIAAGGGHQCALTSDGAVSCWGARFGSTPALLPTRMALP